MTTIAYKHPYVAYDSRLSNEHLILADDFCKMHEQDGVVFFFTGAVAERTVLIDAVLHNKIPAVCDATALVVRPDGIVHIVCVDSGRLWVTPIDTSRVYALGSGCQFAWGAMDMGASAQSAVAQAMLRDPFSGGEVRVFDVDAHCQKHRVGGGSI